MKGKKIKNKKHIDLAFLQILSKLNQKDIEYLLPLLKREQIDIICSVCRNILFSENGLKLKRRHINKIRKLTLPNAKDYKTLANFNSSLKTKKKIIHQRGGMIGTIIGIALPLISSLISSLSSK